MPRSSKDGKGSKADLEKLIKVPGAMSPEDLAYQNHLRGQLQAAEQQLMGARAAMQSWVAYTMQKYQLAPGDTVRESGELVRQEVESEHAS